MEITSYKSIERHVPQPLTYEVTSEEIMSLVNYSLRDCISAMHNVVLSETEEVKSKIMATNALVNIGRLATQREFGGERVQGGITVVMSEMNEPVTQDAVIVDSNSYEDEEEQLYIGTDDY